MAAIIAKNNGTSGLDPGLFSQLHPESSSTLPPSSLLLTSNSESSISSTISSLISSVLPSSSSSSSNLLNNSIEQVLSVASGFVNHHHNVSPQQHFNIQYSNAEISDQSSNIISTSNFTMSPTNVGATSSSMDFVSGGFNCKDGLILKCWHSDDSLSTIIVHGLVYLIALVYTFVGVAIIADRFMASIEQITSQETDVIVRKPNGQKEIISVRIWNETVSNLSLMALGSSAPEIMLSVIEIYAQNFEAGELGPGTIVGSAAFNMFIIIAICIWAVPSDQLKKIKYLRVFIITLSFSVFAYVWMLVILIWSSPGVIDVWEGLLTLAFFFITVLLAYIADRRLLIYKYLDKHYRVKNSKKTFYSNGKVATEIDGTEAEKVEMIQVDIPSGVVVATADTQHIIADGIDLDKNIKVAEVSEDELRYFEDHREHIIEILKDVKARFPDATNEEIESIARNDISRLQPKSRAYYRIISSRRMLGGGGGSTELLTFNSNDNIPLSFDQLPNSSSMSKDDFLTIGIRFDPKEYTVLEDVGSVPVTITRVGDVDSTIVVSYRTEDGTAKAGADYIHQTGSITFGPGEAHKQISIKIINDDEFEEDEHFYVRLFDAKFASVAVDTDEHPRIKILDDQAKINILDDDHSGVFSVDNNVYQIPENIGTYRLTVHRYCGARGQVQVPYRTIPGTARPGEDFVLANGLLTFHNNETSKDIVLEIINNVNYEKNSIFYVELGTPIRRDASPNDDERGAPRLGDLTKCMIRIRESKDFKVLVDNLMRRKKIASQMGKGTSWENQIIDAVKVHKLGHSASMSSDEFDSRGEKVEDQEDQGPDSENLEPKTILDYILHYMTLFWKVVFAFVPPPTIWNGWACFVVSIMVIGALTSLINDLASHFGATVHLKDSITAISLVALGTSVPDTFASKIAAQNEKNADSSIGNVTGSNAVNVFLGIGVAWTVAAVYHAINGTVFAVEAGSLGFSVMLFCGCAFVCSALLMVRRVYLGGELGGPLPFKILSVVILVMLWLFYLTMSTLEAYGVIEGF